MRTCPAAMPAAGQGAEFLEGLFPVAYQNDERHNELVALLTRIAVAVEAQAAPVLRVRTKVTPPVTK